MAGGALGGWGWAGQTASSQSGKGNRSREADEEQANSARVVGLCSASSPLHRGDERREEEASGCWWRGSHRTSVKIGRRYVFILSSSQPALLQSLVTPSECRTVIGKCAQSLTHKRTHTFLWYNIFWKPVLISMVGPPKGINEVVCLSVSGKLSFVRLCSLSNEFFHSDLRPLTRSLYFTCLKESTKVALTAWRLLLASGLVWYYWTFPTWWIEWFKRQTHNVTFSPV